MYWIVGWALFGAGTLFVASWLRIQWISQRRGGQPPNRTAWLHAAAIGFCAVAGQVALAASRIAA
jgi:hypothetical protein